MLATTDQLSADDPEAFENAISITCGMVGRAKALLIKDLSAKRETLRSNPLTLTQWAYIARAPNSMQVGQNPLAPCNTNTDRNGGQMRNAPKRQRNNFGLFHANDTRQADSRQGGYIQHPEFWGSPTTPGATLPESRGPTPEARLWSPGALQQQPPEENGLPAIPPNPTKHQQPHGTRVGTGPGIQ